MKKLIALAMCIIFATRADSFESSFRNKNDELISSHTPPQDVIDGLKEHTDFFIKINTICQRKSCRKKRGRHYVWKFDSLPNYYVKRDISRIRGRELIHACIQKYTLDRIIVPQKYLYHIPDTETELNDNKYWVVAKEVKRSSVPSSITREDAKQICALIKYSGFDDFHRKNFIYTMDNKIAIIDSEASQVKGAEKRCSALEMIFLHKLKIFDANTTFTEDALKYMLTLLSECESLSRKRYNRVLRNLEKQRKPHKWDFVSFF